MMRIDCEVQSNINYFKRRPRSRMYMVFIIILIIFCLIVWKNNRPTTKVVNTYEKKYEEGWVDFKQKYEILVNKIVSSLSLNHDECYICYDHITGDYYYGYFDGFESSRYFKDFGYENLKTENQLKLFARLAKECIERKYGGHWKMLEHRDYDRKPSLTYILIKYIFFLFILKY